MMQVITSLSIDPGTYVMVRSDCNVSCDNGILTDKEALRIDATMVTIQYLREKGCRVIVISHLGDDGQQSLHPVVTYIQEKHHFPCTLVPEITGEVVTQALATMRNGDCVFLENIRRHPGEMNNDDTFAQELAQYAAIYVQDAFSVSHRHHASVVGVPKFLPTYQGVQFHKEYTYLSKVLDPQHPLVVIMGGAKFGTKLEVMKKFASIADTICVGGALANVLYEKKGVPIGDSIADREVDVTTLVSQNNVMLSSQVVTQKRTADMHTIQSDEKILDINVDTWKQSIAQAKTIVWNGPMGYYEGGYTKGTLDLARMITENKQAISLVGGGDTVTALYDSKMLDSFTFVSMAGGAMLEFLATGTLPGIEALEK